MIRSSAKTSSGAGSGRKVRRSWSFRSSRHWPADGSGCCWPCWNRWGRPLSSRWAATTSRRARARTWHAGGARRRTEALYGPATGLAGVHIDLVTSYAYFERVFRVLDVDRGILQTADAIRPLSAKGRLCSTVSLVFPDGEAGSTTSPAYSGRTVRRAGRRVRRGQEHAAGLVPGSTIRRPAACCSTARSRSLDLKWLRSHRRRGPGNVLVSRQRARQPALWPAGGGGGCRGCGTCGAHSRSDRVAAQDAPIVGDAVIGCRAANVSDSPLLVRSSRIRRS